MSTSSESEIQKANDHLSSRKVLSVDEISLKLFKEAGKETIKCTVTSKNLKSELDKRILIV